MTPFSLSALPGIALQKIRGIDRGLLLALLLALVFSLYGVQWGRVECWNEDQMALKSYGRYGEPGSFLKPPLYTYLNHILVTSPVYTAGDLVGFLTGKEPNTNTALVLCSRLLVIAFFLGTIALCFSFARTFFGLFAARVIALLVATSAGFIAFNHFLTCDSPLLFWMMLAVYFSGGIATSGRRSDYLLAGLATGLAAALKYNGLGVGISLVVAHYFATRGEPLKGRIFSTKLILGLVMVPVGFLIGNPYALLDHRRFVADFMYNYTVTPRFAGEAEGHSYLAFLLRFPEILGVPGTWLVVVAVAVSAIIVLFRDRTRGPAAAGFALALSVFALYYYKMGSFPRTETRFVLPSAPLLLLMTGPFFLLLSERRRWVYPVLVPILLFNCLCSALVGYRFSEDPRLPVLDWAIRNLRPGTRIESSSGCPHWRKLPGLDVTETRGEKPEKVKKPEMTVVDIRMPRPCGRMEIFERIFKGNKWVENQLQQRERTADSALFTPDQLQLRNPDFLAIHSHDYETGDKMVDQYYLDLIAEKMPYRVVYDAQSMTPPAWSYPQEIEYLKNRFTVLERKK